MNLRRRLAFRNGQEVLKHFVPGYKPDPDDELNEDFIQSPPEHSDVPASATEEERAKQTRPRRKTQ